MCVCELASGSWRKKAQVAVAPNLPVAVLLGRDIYQEEPSGDQSVSAGLMVETRAQAKKRTETGNEEPIADTHTCMSDLEADAGSNQHQEDQVEEEELPTEEGDPAEGRPDDVLPLEPMEEHIPEEGDQVDAPVTPTATNLTTDVLSATPDQIKELQQADPTLRAIRDRIKGGVMEDKSATAKFYYQNSLLYRSWKKRGSPPGLQEYD